MEIAVSQEQGRVPVAVFRLTGPVTDSAELEQRARELVANGAQNLLIDLSGVPYMATAGLRALHAIYTLLRSNAPEESDSALKSGIMAGTYYSPHLKLFKPTAHVLEALRTAGYDMFLQIHNDYKEALASF